MRLYLGFDKCGTTTRRTDGGFDKCGTTTRRTDGGCDKYGTTTVQTASISKTTSDLCTDEDATIKSTTTRARSRLGLYV